MAKRKGPSTSRPRDRSKVAKEGSESKTASERGVEDECEQLEREVRALEGERSRLSEEKRRLEEQLEEQLRPLRREMEQVQRNLLTKRKRIVEVENAKRLEAPEGSVGEDFRRAQRERPLSPGSELQVLSSKAGGAGGAVGAEPAVGGVASSCFEDGSQAEGLWQERASVSWVCPIFEQRQRIDACRPKGLGRGH